MAEILELQEEQNIHPPSPAPGSTGTGAPKQGGGGRAVLDKDGKPCRSCNSLRDLLRFNRQQKLASQSISTTQPTPASTPQSQTFKPLDPNLPAAVAATITSTSTTDTSPAAAHTPDTAPNLTSEELPPDCPPDVEGIGRAAWTLLHTVAATYPEKPSKEDKEVMRTFMGSFAKVYPCWVCSDGLREWMGREENRINGGGGNSGGKGNTSTNAKPPRVDWLGSRKMFGLWMCRAHNEVNVKLGKKEFDCRRVEERWLKGWEDGRCG